MVNATVALRRFDVIIQVIISPAAIKTCGNHNVSAHHTLYALYVVNMQLAVGGYYSDVKSPKRVYTELNTLIPYLLLHVAIIIDLQRSSSAHT